MFTRSKGQITRFRFQYYLLRVGEKIEKDIIFYCPERNKLIEIKSGNIYLGEV